MKAFLEKKHKKTHKGFIPVSDDVKGDAAVVAAAPLAPDAIVEGATMFVGGATATGAGSEKVPNSDFENSLPFKFLKIDPFVN